MDAIALQDELCEHFCSEPSVEVETKHRPKIIRVGTPTENSRYKLRPRSIGKTTYRRHTVLWGSDTVDGQQTFFARVRSPVSSKSWGMMIEADSPHKLADKCIRAAGATATSAVSAAQFFGFPFFEKLDGKFTFPPVPHTATCFDCSAVGQPRWRFDATTLARTCEACRTRPKRKAAEITDDNSDSKDLRRRGYLFTWAVISSGMQFHKLHKVCVKSEITLPVREGQFYEYQRELIPPIASWVAMSPIPSLPSVLRHIVTPAFCQDAEHCS